MKPKFGYIYMSFVISLSILVVLSWLYYERYNALMRYSNHVDENNQVLYHLHKLNQLTRELESSTRGFILTADSVFLENFPSQLQKLSDHNDSLKILLAADTAQRNNIKLLELTTTERIFQLRRSMQRAESNDTQALNLSLMHGKTLMDRFNKEISAIEKTERIQGTEFFNQKQRYQDITPNFFRVILVFAGVITIISFFFIQREMRIRLRYQNELEQRINELNRSNAELEQFAKVASHDLQEPLRKILTFSDRLFYKYKPHLDEEAKMIIERIDLSAHRMQELIEDMVNFTNLINRDESTIEVDLNFMIEKVLAEYDDIENIKKPILQNDELPNLKGYPGQLFLLFRAIFDNAVKFAKPGEPADIKIIYEHMEGLESNGSNHNQKKFYHKIRIEDKGIGFDNEFAEKIFVIFQRLHNQESQYRGKGIGLAIAQRVMTNHNGYIMAKGVLGEGASFMLYFPADRA